MPRRWIVVAVSIALVAAIAVVVIWSQRGSVPFARGEGCTVKVGDTLAELDLEQAKYASLIAATASKRGLPARATTIAIATAYQESKVRNIDYGDRDSLGLFQQRPSQGWGTPDQIKNPRYSIAKFFEALEKVDGYRDMMVTEAAQKVQRSAFGGAYADHEDYARALASSLSGNSDAAFTCQLKPPAETGQEPGTNALTANAEAVRVDVAKGFGSLRTGGYAPGGVDSGHSEGSAHYEGKAVDFFFRPINAESLKRGWSLAQYLLANAKRLEIKTVIYDDRIWTARRSDQGWRDYQAPDRGGDQDILRHRDHVHVDVA